MTTPTHPPSTPTRDDVAGPVLAAMTAREMLALYDKFMSGTGVTDAERKTIDGITLAATFGMRASCQHIGCDGGATIAMLRAFLTALVDPMHPDLDYLRRDPAAAAAARSGGAA